MLHITDAHSPWGTVGFRQYWTLGTVWFSDQGKALSICSAEWSEYCTSMSVSQSEMVSFNPCLSNFPSNSNNLIDCMKYVARLNNVAIKYISLFTPFTTRSLLLLLISRNVQVQKPSTVAETKNFSSNCRLLFRRTGGRMYQRNCRNTRSWLCWLSRMATMELTTWIRPTSGPSQVLSSTPSQLSPQSVSGVMCCLLHAFTGC